MKTTFDGRKPIRLLQQVFLLLSLSTGFAAYTQVSFQGTSSAYKPGDGSGQLSLSHTTSVNTNFLVVAVTAQDQPVTSVVFDNQPLTLAVTATRNSMTVGLYYLINPPVTTSTVTVSTSASTDLAVSVVNYGNVNTALPLVQTAASSGLSTQASVTVASSAGQLVVDAIGTNANTVSVSSQQIQTSLVGGSHANGSSYRSGLTPATTTQWTLNGSGNWGMVAVSVRAASVLPVKLRSFAALADGNDTQLRWETASETGVRRFVVERSIDGTSFLSLGTVAATGGADAAATYTFRDRAAATQFITYYRLRVEDADGHFTLSPVAVVNRVVPKEVVPSISIYPNPASQLAVVNMPAKWEGKRIVVELFDAIGNPVQKMVAESGERVVRLDLSHFRTGLYRVRASCNGESAQQTVVRR